MDVSNGDSRFLLIANIYDSMQTSIQLKVAGKPSTTPQVVHALRCIGSKLRVPLSIVAAVSGAWLFIQCVAEEPSVPMAVTAAASALAAGFLPSTSSRKGGEA